MSTYTRSHTSTYTEARARYVMGKVKDDLYGLMNRSLITQKRVDTIYNSLLYLLNHEVLHFFELQFKKGNGHPIGGLRYEVNTSGTIYSDKESGAIDYWSLPDNTRVDLLVDLDQGAKNYQQVMDQLSQWGWGTGRSLEGKEEHLKNYSKDGYGLSQKIIGDWQ